MKRLDEKGSAKMSRASRYVFGFLTVLGILFATNYVNGPTPLIAGNIQIHK